MGVFCLWIAGLLTFRTDGSIPPDPFFPFNLHSSLQQLANLCFVVQSLLDKGIIAPVTSSAQFKGFYANLFVLKKDWVWYFLDKVPEILLDGVEVLHWNWCAWP